MSEESQADNHPIDVVARMLNRAAAEGLLAEVVWKYGDYRASGDSEEAAAAAALCDWDC